MASKYTDAEIEAMGAKGQAYRNPDGHYSYPVADVEDLDNAIRAVGRGGADHDAIRKYVIGRAKALGKSSMIPDTWNADGSLKESKAAGRQEFELRKRRRGSMIRQVERRNIPFARGQVEVRARPDGTGGTSYTFEGYGAVFDAPFQMWDPWGDEYTELVRQGAFTRTLAASPDVPFLIGHNDQGVPLARTRSGTMQLTQDTHGLHVVAQMDGNRSDVRNLASAVERGDLDEMSIGFVTLAHQWSPDWEQRDMLDLELHRGDVSAVALAANAATSGSTMIALSSRRPGERRTPTQPYTAHDGEANECVQCHSVNDDTAQFCDQCGTRMMPKGHVSNMAGVEDMTQYCGCGKWNSADAKFCGQCGDDLAAAAGSSPGAFWWKDGRPREQRMQDEITDTSNHPDFNLADDPAANGRQAVKCPYAKKNGCGQMCPGGARFCPSCGGPLYQADGTLVVDDSGVVEESKGDADLLSRRLRLLELA